MSLLMRESPHLSNEIEERRRPNKGNKDQPEQEEREQE